ncbi:MAG: peptide-methionine (S)-S-oxide reductase MsrA [Candidatus Obscuribacterales bacterium]|nr:peptide-methionine (S)-S-oxide reductase MsrA [Candidatus Obscuribacterales bacterium]
MPGVLDTAVGYCGGTTEHPTYETVCSGRTGHAETVEVSFDPEKTTYTELLKHFFSIHNPTQGNRQGFNIGSQYRSAVFCSDDQQLAEAEALKDAIEKQVKRKVTTEIAPLKSFWRAEDYHQQYYLKRTGGACRI